MTTPPRPDDWGMKLWKSGLIWHGIIRRPDGSLVIAWAFTRKRMCINLANAVAGL